MLIAIPEEGFATMKPLSPVDAIAPAFDRARTILAPPPLAPGQPVPFRFWFFFKIALIGALGTSGFYGLTLGFAGQAVSFATMAAGAGIRHRHSFFVAPSGAAAALMAAALIAGLVGLALWAVCGWLWCRLRFTLFDLVVYRHGQVGLAWSRYGAQAWRYLGLLAIVSLVFLLLLAVTAGPVFLHFILSIRNLGPDQINRDPSVLFAHIFPMYGLILLFGLLGTLVDALMQDFLLPPMAIQDASIADSVARLFDLVRDRPGTLALYLLLRFVIEIGLTWVGTMAVLVVLGILGLGGAGVGFLLFRALWHTGAAGIAGFILYCVVAGLILFGLYLLVMISLYGAIAAFRQSYAALFFGSHYPELGNVLEPPQPVPAGLAPPPPPLEGPFPA